MPQEDVERIVKNMLAALADEAEWQFILNPDVDQPLVMEKLSAALQIIGTDVSKLFRIQAAGV